MKKVTRLLAMGMVLVVCQCALAIPTLQLDIAGGVYDSSESEESTITDADAFELYALLIPDADSTVSGLYRIAAALTPKTAETDPSPSLGSIKIEGTDYDVTADMGWGVPPLALLDGTDEVGDCLPKHGIFQTYFLEIDVVFDEARKLGQYNVQEQVGDPDDFPGTGMYWQSLDIDVSGLAEGYGIRFDLYQVAAGGGALGKHAKKASELTTDIIEFAPFSHDASGDTGRDDVPDAGATLGLLGLALAALAGLKRLTARV